MELTGLVVDLIILISYLSTDPTYLLLIYTEKIKFFLKLWSLNLFEAHVMFVIYKKGLVKLSLKDCITKQ